jgi:hypothetical protein
MTQNQGLSSRRNPILCKRMPRRRVLKNLQSSPLELGLPSGRSLASAVYTVTCGNESHCVTLTGDMDDDLDAIEALEDSLFLHTSMNGRCMQPSKLRSPEPNLSNSAPQKPMLHATATSSSMRMHTFLSRTLSSSAAAKGSGQCSILKTI